MADSAFWRDLAAQFRALPLECSMLRADRQCTIDSGVSVHWTLVGTVAAKADFQALAMRAASEIPSPTSPDLLTAWLEALMKQEGCDLRHEIIAADLRSISMFTLPATAANFCKMLESDALQVEAEEKRRNDPRNWSPLRQQFEAVRQLKNLITGHHETITEQFVREALARQYGIKPEDVTWNQIRFEVAHLSREYPITYIPTAPASESTNGATPEPGESAEPGPTNPQPSTDDLIERRTKLLAEYKAATGKPSDYSIYNASNSEIHKPEFYKWKKGTLSARSITAVNFERFLREKKPPTPKS